MIADDAVFVRCFLSSLLATVLHRQKSDMKDKLAVMSKLTSLDQEVDKMRQSSEKIKADNLRLARELKEAQREDLKQENAELRSAVDRLQAELSELYQRIEVLDNLEISVAELIQENERLRQLITKVNHQIQHDF